MRINIKTIGSWLLLIVVAGAAFHAGADLRDRQYFHLSESRTSHVQASALLKLTPEWSPVPVGQFKQGSNADRALFKSVYNLVKGHYVDPVTPEMETSMARGAVKGMIDALGDPDSRFMDPSERKLLDDAGNGRFYGIGAILTLKREKVDKEGAVVLQTSTQKSDQKGVLQANNISRLDTVKIIVVAPMPGSPAEKAGLKPGDSITYIDNKWIITSDPFLMANMDKLAKAVRNKEVDEFQYQKAFEAAEKKLSDGLDIPAALETLTAKSSGEVTIRVDRAGSKKPVEMKIQCTQTYSNPIDVSKLESGIKYIRISQFNKSAADVFSKEMDKTHKDKTSGLILDLRNNPGGLISSGISIAGKLTGGGKLGTVIESTRNRVLSIPKSEKVNVPVVVLINNGTASVAELVASSLKSNISASLVGEKTFGDGLTQTPLLLKDGSAAVLTTGRMLTASGTDFNAKGISPDRVIPQSSQEKDTQLQEAQRILLAKIGKH